MPAVEVLFRTFFQAGFECSTHKLPNGRRLDLLASTKHDVFAAHDYRRLREFGIRTIRIAARWHLIEHAEGIFDFDSLTGFLDAAEAAGVEILLDLLHFGWPDHVDVFSPAFKTRFARLTFELTKYLKRKRYSCHIFAPINEASFLSWAGGEEGYVNPCTIGRGDELKRNLIRAAAASSEVLLNEVSNARLIAPEPLIHIAGDPDIPGDEIEAAMYTEAQHQSWDMLSGRVAPELGGKPEYLDVLGVNFYDRNEWVHNSEPLSRDDPRYRPLRDMLREIWVRYQRPIFISETGTEDCGRADWFNYVCDEVFAALSAGVPVRGICLYPILNHPGWDDDRHCLNGLFDYADAAGNREVHWPLADALRKQQQRFAAQKGFSYDLEEHRPDLPFASPMGICLSAAATLNEPFCAPSPGLLL